MITLDHIAQALALAGCTALLVIAEPALNRCHASRTRLCVRLSMLLIGAGAVLVIGSVLSPTDLTIWPGVAALSCGSALLLHSTRRRSLRS